MPRSPTYPGLLNSLLTLAGMELRRGERGGGSGMLSNNFRFPSLDLALEVVLVTDKDKGSVKLGCPKLAKELSSALALEQFSWREILGK